MTLFNVEFSLSLRILGLDHYLFSCSHQVFAYVVSRNLHFDPIHLFIRSLWNYIDFCHYNENHFFHACLIIKYHMHFLWQAFQNMRLRISIQLISFTIPELVNTTRFNKLHLDIGVNSSSLTHIPIHTVIIACYHSHTRSCRGIHLVIWALSWTLIHYITYITNMIINSCSYTQQDGLSANRGVN